MRPRLALRLAPLALAALAGCATAPAPEPPPAPPEPAPAPPPAPPPPEPDRSAERLTIAMVGDMMIGTDFPDDRLPDDDAVGFLAGVESILRSADLTIGNLEGVLMDGGEPVKQCKDPSACYLFRSPTRYASIYRDAGFDLMSLANNHARDFGEEGRESSAAALQAVGILTSGAAGTYAAGETSHRPSFAFIAFSGTKGANPMLDEDIAVYQVSGLAREYDIVIVSFHGGAEGLDALNLPFAEEEYYGEPRGDVVRFARAMVDAGADLVFGHGPHVVRAMERYRGRLIAYSLGNFATYYGISVAGLKGIAPILFATLDGEGNFVEGRIVSTRQLRPAGPTVDPEGRALSLAADLSRQDFGNPGIEFAADGTLRVIDRPAPKPHPAAGEETGSQSSPEPVWRKSTPSARNLR